VEAMKNAENFHCRFAQDVKNEVATMKQTICQKRRKLTKLQLETEFMHWVPDIRYSRSRESKTFKLIELYWLNKAFIAQVVDERGQQHQAILQNLDILEKKFEAVCKEVFDIEFRVSDHTDSQDDPEAAAGQAQTSGGTPSNPMRLDEDLENPVDIQNR
jgi:hypothetical protein